MEHHRVEVGLAHIASHGRRIGVVVHVDLNTVLLLERPSQVVIANVGSWHGNRLAIDDARHGNAHGIKGAHVDAIHLYCGKHVLNVAKVHVLLVHHAVHRHALVGKHPVRDGGRVGTMQDRDDQDVLRVVYWTHDLYLRTNRRLLYSLIQGVEEHVQRGVHVKPLEDLARDLDHHCVGIRLLGILAPVSELRSDHNHIVAVACGNRGVQGHCRKVVVQRERLRQRVELALVHNGRHPCRAAQQHPRWPARIRVLKRGGHL